MCYCTLNLVFSMLKNANLSRGWIKGGKAKGSSTDLLRTTHLGEKG